ncbi:unnamed protein product [Fraxinus pennsylvanica]|uniref:Uncharacterized protein n=1 Tax=Fraxinus pennsylvanica TaxID=56036 RepID=A0AAD1ZJZ9_9LAMI|nr:unnamed protein product [Fraxinus pennsylvanica]
MIHHLDFWDKFRKVLVSQTSQLISAVVLNYWRVTVGFPYYQPMPTILWIPMETWRGWILHLKAYDIKIMVVIDGLMPLSYYSLSVLKILYIWFRLHGKEVRHLKETYDLESVLSHGPFTI